MKIDNYGKYQKYTFGSDTLTVSVITLGAIVESLKYKGKETVLRYDDAEGYLSGSAYICAVIGRCANRIGGARFTLNGKEYILPANMGTDQLHGGPLSYESRAWDAEVLSDNAVRFTLFSPDGDNGYPGNLTVSVTYTVTGDALRLDFGGKCDADTVYAPTSHMYFNLGGESVLEHDMSINAKGYLEYNDRLIPTGKLLPCDGEFDFSQMRRIGRDYDNAFILAGEDACAVEHDGVRLEVSTNFPAIQVYTAISMTPPHWKNCGLAIEPEAYPDSMNHAEFPSVVLRAGEEYQRWAEYRFSTKG